MERCIALLFCLFAFVSGQCCQKEVDYCPLLVPSGLSRTCTTFGSGHIHTFDGLSYNIHEYGDFYLVTNYGTPESFSIQVRQSDCSSGNTLAIPVNERSTVKGSCNRAFAFHSGTTPSIEIRHDVNTDYITVLNGNNPLPTSTFYSGVLGGLTVTPMAYVTTTADISRSLGADADFYVTGTFQGLAFKIWFYASGYSTFQVFLPSEMALGFRLGGLCGFVDGCAANDLALRSNPPLNPPSMPPASILETVRNTNEISVSAGSLPDEAQFINQTAADPTKWAPAFGASWRVDSGNTAFWTENDSPNLRWTASNYDISSSGSCNFPQGWSTPAFLVDQCSIDLQFKPDTVNGFQFGALPSFHVMMSYCSYYCSAGVFPFLNPNLLPNHCDGYCTYPQGSTNGIPNITAIYGQAPDWQLPPFNFYQTNDPQALYTSSLNLAGVYTFQLTSTDSCQSFQYNLTRTLTCTNKVNVQPVTNTPIVRRIHTYNGIYPTVQVFIPSPGGFVRLQTTFIQYPNIEPSWQTIWGGDAGDKSLAPVFTPDSSVPGTYIIQLSMYDGCSIVYQNISIIAACSSCTPTAIVANPNLKDVIWGAAFNTPVGGPQRTGVQAFPTKTLNAVTPATNEPYTATAYNYNWAILNDDNSIDEIVLNAGAYEVRRFQDSSIAAFAMMYPFGFVVNSTFTNSTDAPQTTAPVPNPTPTLPALKGPTNSQFGVTPPQREFNIQRSDTTTTTTTTTVVTHFANVSYTQIAPYNVPCTINVGTANNGQTATVGFTPVPATFNAGAACVGQYNLRLNVSEPSCAWAKDDQKLDVDCGPTPDVFVKCLAQIQFNYATGLFPVVAIDATATTDPYGRTPTFLFGYASQPPNSTTQLLPVSQAVRNANVSAPGTYEVWVNVSNGCNSAVAISTFNAYCTGSASEVSANFLFIPSTTVNYDGSTFGSQTVSIQQNSFSTNPDVLANLLYTWSFVNLPPNPQPLWVNPPTIAPTTSPTPTITLTYANTTIGVQMIASQGCGQSATQTGSIMLYCDAQSNPTLTSSAPGQQTITWTQNVGWGPNIPTLTGVPNWNFNTAPQPGAVAPHNSMTDTPLNLPNVSVASNTGATPLTYVPLVPAIIPLGGFNNSVTYWSSDGCKYVSAPSLNFSWICYGSTISFTTSLTQVANTSTYTVDLDASASNFSMGYFPAWLVIAPNGTTTPIVTTVNQTFAQFQIVSAGVYTIIMIYTDGCEILNTTSTVTHPGCFNLTLNPGAYLGGGTGKITSVTWSSNGFPKFELNGNGSDTGGRNMTFLPTYAWIVYAAPNASIYAPTTTRIVVQSTVLNTTTVPVLIGSYYYTTTNLTWTNTTTTTTTFVTLANSNAINANTWFPSCLTPDVAGTYVVGLVVSDGCQTQISNLTLQAFCDPAPSIGVNVTEHPNLNNDTSYVKQTSPNAWTVTLTRAAPRRVVLDARSTLMKTNSSSRLTFYWSWNSPDPRAGTQKAQDGFEAPYASTTTLALSAVGTYNISLTVHDGCSVSSQLITLTATCGDKNVGGPVMSSNINSDGRTYATIKLNAAGSCAVNTWSLTNFTTSSKYSSSGVSSAGSVTKPSAISVFTILFYLFTSKFL